MGLLSRPFIAVASALDRRKPWHERSRLVGLFVLDGIRLRLRRENLYDTGLIDIKEGEIEPRTIDERTISGAWNDLDWRLAGSSGTRFGRNSPRRFWFPEAEPELLEPNPRLVSTELLTREEFKPAETLNQLAAAWIQFEVHDWLGHDTDRKAQPFTFPVQDSKWGSSEMSIFRTVRDGRSAGDLSPPAFLTLDSHWWDGSQVYGRDADFARRIRAGEREPGKLRMTDVPVDGRTERLPPPDLLREEDLAGVAGNFWVGLGLLHVLFMREHNLIVEKLSEAHPSLTDDELYAKARLVNAALMAKIHTVEWTPAIVAHPTTVLGMRASWYGLLGERFQRRVGRIGRGDLLSGIPGSRTDSHGVPYSLTEEFVAVYRMHPLLPDTFEFKSVATSDMKATYAFSELGARDAYRRIVELGMVDSLYSFGVGNPGALVLHNYPTELQNLTRPNGDHIDLAATDILRIRESGVPRYNDFRRLFHLRPATSFEDVTGSDTTEQRNDAKLMREIYDGRIERLDLMVGLFAEPPPDGFGFSDTAFRVFLLMASRRLKADRFFTNDFTADVYTSRGLEWIRDRTMVKMLRDHYPELEPELAHVTNAFKPWDDLELQKA